MLTISQFAKECKTTVKTIRHYDNIGLLKADYVSAENGYRFYRRKTAAKYYHILALRESGFSLKEIKAILSPSDPSMQLAHLEQKILLLKKQTERCESIKKEYENMLAESKNFIVSKTKQELRVFPESKAILSPSGQRNVS